MEDRGYAHPEVLVDTAWAESNLDNPKVRFIEVDVDTEAYDSGHIPGAVGWNWQQDTQEPIQRDIPDRARFEALMSRSGVGRDTTVVLYGDTNNWFAAFAFWLLEYYGHAEKRLLDGGRAKWVAEGRPMTRGRPRLPTTNYKINAVQESVRALREFVLDSVRTNGRPLVDVRSPAEFSGELLAPENLPQEGSQRGGHIPGAINVPWSMAVAEDGTFKPIAELQEIYESNGVSPDKEVIAYCRIGERSSHTWFVLRYLLGVAKARNYDGSWTEYGSLIAAPIER